MHTREFPCFERGEGGGGWRGNKIYFDLIWSEGEDIHYN
jgi:hypothetical protein